ncbi:TonB-dependent receptor domain-containing protein [Albibacterium indicum]|uniref:TonB-dependent receptor domain-containing protein n=1 Tax=Albibacterium indicum TaxID=2292082 RepID=UPI000E54D504|nr:TonB-dependent receptor [Pedobacter indicus]
MKPFLLPMRNLIKVSTSLLCSLVFLFQSFAVSAQQAPNYTIEGKVTDTLNRSLDYATINLLQASDSSVVKVMFTDENGDYRLSDLKEGNYLVQAELLGFAKNTSQQIILSPTRPYKKIDNIVLHLANNELNAIVITGQRPLIERKSDMLVVNVESSTLAAGNNAMDILERSPGITVDKDDNISLNGKKGIMVMIDGKQTYLSSEQLGSLLRSTDGNTIQSIEIINNPSSKYDAAGGPGIINIKLKKNKMSGTNGSFNAGAGYGNGHKANTSLNVNHKSGKFNVFGTYSYQENDRTDIINIYRIVGGENQFTSFDQGNSMTMLRKNHSLRAGVDYQTSEKNTVSFQASGLLTDAGNENIGGVQIGSFQSPLDSTLIANTLLDEDFRSLSFNLNNTYNIDTLGRKLSVDADYSSFFEDASANYTNTFYNPDGSLLHEPLESRSLMPSKIYIQAYKADYTHPLNENSGLEAGLKYANVKTDNDLKFSERTDGQWINDENRSNHFVYREQVAAGYISYHTTLDKFGFKAGLRSEYTISDGNSLTLSNRVKRDYIDFFPNASVSYNPSDDHQYSISYSKRINRPRYNNLNPFSYFLDQYTSVQGNPYLQPEYTHALAVNYTLLKRFNFSTGYEITKDAVVEIMKQNDVSKSTFITNENIAQQKQWFLNVNAPVRFTKFWNSNTNITGFYLGFESENENSINYGQYAMQLTSNQNFTILPSLTAEATLNYQSGLQYSIYKIADAWSIDAGINKSFNNKKANIKLSVSDVFNTRDQYVTTQHANLNAIIDQKRETRVFRLSLTYNFGNTKIGSSKQYEKSDEEKRIGK